MNISSIYGHSPWKKRLLCHGNVNIHLNNFYLGIFYGDSEAESMLRQMASMVPHNLGTSFQNFKWNYLYLIFGN
jgi:hypothetical protein